MLTNKQACDIAEKIKNIFYKRTTAFVTPDDIYNEAFLTAKQQKAPALGWIHAKFACNRLIKWRIHSRSKHALGENDSIARRYVIKKKNELLQHQQTAEDMFLAIDTSLAISRLSKKQQRLLFLRFHFDEPLVIIAKKLHMSREKTGHLEHFTLLSLRRSLNDWGLL